jgi:hypothetical protein
MRVNAVLALACALGACQFDRAGLDTPPQIVTLPGTDPPDAMPSSPDAAPGPCTPPPTTAALVQVPHTALPPSIDGVLGEPAWTMAARVSFTDATRSDNQVEVRLLWTDEQLALAFIVTDAQLETADGNAVWQNDGAEFYLDPEHDATAALDNDDHHYITNIQGEVYGGALTLATVSSGAGYTQEIAVSFAALKVMPAVQLVMGVLLGNNDLDAGTAVQFDWNRLIETGNYAQPALWADLELVATPPNCPP